VPVRIGGAFYNREIDEFIPPNGAVRQAVVPDKVPLSNRTPTGHGPPLMMGL
jgi:hypothetical protein